MFECVIYKRLIIRMRTYGCKTGGKGKQCENLLRSFERKLCGKYLARCLKMDVRGGAKTLIYLSFLMEMML